MQQNAKTLAEIINYDFRIISGGTDNHLMLIDMMGSKGITGKQAEKALENAGISTNKNMIPFDQRNPMDPSGIRLGTPALTTRGMEEREMEVIAGFINQVIDNINNKKVIMFELEGYTAYSHYWFSAYRKRLPD